MTSTNSNESHKNGISKRNSMSMESKSSPSVLLWMWNWFAALPKIISNWYADFKSGELFARVPLLDAMCQFIVAVATSCHPQEEPMNDDDLKENNSHSPNKTKNEVKVFQGTARTLRSRTVEKN